MALKAFKEHVFKAEIKFEDESVKEVEFRLPRNTDVYTSDDGNTNLNTIYTFANMAKPFSTPLQVEIEDGSILNVTNLRWLIDLGVVINFTDVAIKWLQAKEKSEAEKNRLVKKPKSDGNSAPKDIPTENL